jgi:membrane fusion protein, multidrug efflux system
MVGLHLVKQINMPSTLGMGFIACALCFSLTACKDEESQKTTFSPEVQVVTAGKENLPVYSEYVGQTYGLSDITIQPRIEGWITGMYFKEGSLVQKGSLLYTIDDATTVNLVDEAEAQLASAQTSLVKNKSDLDRVKPLTEMNALSQRDLDASVANYEAAKNQVTVAEARLANSKVQLGYFKMTAPITGIIGISKVQVGDYVSKVSLQNGINEISSLGEVRVRFPVSENDYLVFLRRYRKDPKSTDFYTIPVDLILGDGSLFGEKGNLQLTNRQIDPTTGSILVQAVFKNSLGILRPGQYVRVRFQTDEFNNAVVVPQQAVNQLQNIYQVYLLTDSNKIKPTIIKVGARVGSNWIVTQGLKEGDKLAVLGSRAITPRMVVKPIEMKWNYDSTSKN